jgi:RHS repeat-associated protein
VSPYAYNSSNELLSTPSLSYTYDHNGNTLTKSDDTHYAWDYDNRLKQVTLPAGGGTVTFKYDPFGRRIQKAFTQGVTSTTTNYFYDGARPIEEVDSSGNLLGRHTHGPVIDEVLSDLRLGIANYYEQDALGSVTSQSNVAGTVANTYLYGAFGVLTSSTGTSTNPFRFTGREFDLESGIYEYRARYFDQNSGRFISEDPIRVLGGINYYQYVRNSPTALTDPTGLNPCLNINAFVNALNHNAAANANSTGKCATYVRQALEESGANTSGHPQFPKDYGPFLVQLGFSEISVNGYSPRAGDVAIIQPYNQDAPGHIEGWTGSQWVSDFPQHYYPKTPGSGVYPGQPYRNKQPPYAIYRPTPCPVSAP